ncbi:MAG TPA: undecaprenyl-diphosphate phosphatase [Pseudonocardiaceae bacterium]
MTYLEAIVVGAFQGVTELFPVSSLGHSVLIPALVGGEWARDLNVSAPESPYLAFIVGLHVATAAALLLFFWRDWLRILGGLVSSIRYREMRTPAQRLAWLIIIATIPVGIAGLALDHLFRTTLGRPIPAAAFLMVNGVVLYVGERLRRRAEAGARADAVPDTAAGITASGAADPEATVVMAAVGWDPNRQMIWPARDPDAAGHSAHEIEHYAEQAADAASDSRLARLSIARGTLIGSAQILALLPGISRSGITMVAGLLRGLSHEDAARFSFLLATPVILAAGVLKIPDLFGPMGAGIHGQVLAGSIAAFVAAYVAVRFLTHYFRTRTLTPFAIYCALAGAGSLAWLTLG